MVEFRAAVETWRVKRKLMIRIAIVVSHFSIFIKGIDVLPFFVTLLTCLLLGLELGMVIGISVNIFFILYMTSRPKTRINRYDINGCEILLIEPNQSLVYTAAEHLKSKILKHSLSDEHNISTVVIDGHFVWSMDSTVAKVNCLLSASVSLAHWVVYKFLHRRWNHASKNWIRMTKQSFSGIGDHNRQVWHGDWVQILGSCSKKRKHWTNLSKMRSIWRRLVVMLLTSRVSLFFPLRSIYWA